jgi:hypothetical protein
LTDDSSNPAQVKQLGWRQGSILPSELFQEVGIATHLEFCEGKAYPIVISQDCDVVHHSYSDEPFIEIIRATSVERPDGSLQYAKSSRKLHLELVATDSHKPFQLSIHERRLIDRKLLEKCGPSKDLTVLPDDIRLLADWISRRYRRDSFPDEFVRRISEKKGKKHLKKLLEAQGKLITGIFLLLNSSRDLTVDTPYKITVYATVRTQTYDDDLQRQHLEDNFLDNFTNLLKNFSGIEVVDYFLVSEAEFSLDDVRNTRRMDFDSISYTDEKGGDIAKTF